MLSLSLRLCSFTYPSAFSNAGPGKGGGCAVFGFFLLVFDPQDTETRLHLDFDLLFLIKLLHKDVIHSQTAVITAQ